MRKKLLIAISLFFITAATYIVTTPKSVYTGDSGEIATAIYAWGVAHPTGFPTYMILARLFSYLLPMLEFSYRLNIFSALIAGMTAGILFLILQRFQIPPASLLKKGARRNFWPSAAASLVFAFGFSAWSHAGTIQIYSLTVFFFALAILIFLHWLETKKTWALYLLAIILALGAGTHLTFLLVILFLAAYLIVGTGFKPVPTKKMIIAIFVFLALVAAIYSYIPWRAAANPELNWGDPSTRENFINYITQRDYSEKIGTRSFGSWGLMLKETGRLMSREFTWLGFIFVVIGAVVAFKKNKPFFYAGLAVVFSNVLLLGNYGDKNDIIVLWRYFLPSYFVMAIFLSFAFSVIPAASPATSPAKPLVIQERSGKLGERSGKAGISTLILPAIIFIAHFGALNRHNSTIVQETTKNIFASLPESSILIVSGDTLFGSTLYEQLVLRRYPQPIVISDKLYTQPWYLAAKKKELVLKGFAPADSLPNLLAANSGRPIYSVSNSIPFFKADYDFLPEGIIYRITAKKDGAKVNKEKNEIFWAGLDLKFLADKNSDREYFLRELVGLYTAGANNFAAELFNGGAREEGIKYFEKSLSIRENKNALYNLAGIYNGLGEMKKALDYKNRFDALK